VQSAGPACRLGCHDVARRGLLCALDLSASRISCGWAADVRYCDCPPGRVPAKEALMVPLLLWILGVPGLIIILLLLLGVIKI
jgi:hypothetical protein